MGNGKKQRKRNGIACHAVAKPFFPLQPPVSETRPDNFFFLSLSFRNILSLVLCEMDRGEELRSFFRAVFRFVLVGISFGLVWLVWFVSSFGSDHLVREKVAQVSLKSVR